MTDNTLATDAVWPALLHAAIPGMLGIPAHRQPEI